MYSGKALQYYLLTGRRQNSNDSCQWSFEPTPLLFNWYFSLLISPTKLFGFVSSRVHKFWTPRAKASGFARSPRQLSTTSDVKRVAQQWSRQAESSASPAPLPTGEQRKQDRRGETSLFVKHILSFFGFGLSLKCWAEGGRGILVFMWGVLRACWGPSQACTVGCWGSEQSRGLVVSWACSWAVTVSNWLRSTHNSLKAHWPTLSLFSYPPRSLLSLAFFPSAKLRQWSPHGLFHWTVWSKISQSFL